MTMNHLIPTTARRLPILLSRPPPLLRPWQRTLHTTPAFLSTVKPSISLLARLRQETQVSMTKAKEALVKTNNDYDAALVWLQEDEQASGAKKAEKVKGRTASEGLVGVASMEALGRGAGVLTRGAIVELNCETDFVSRNDAFRTLVTQIATTALFLHDLVPVTATPTRYIHPLPLELILSAPLLPHPTSTASTSPTATVHDSILSLIGKLGENITLRRAAVMATLPNVVPRGSKDRVLLTSHYVHGGSDVATGKIGALVVMGVSEAAAGPGVDVARLGRNLARQVVGYAPRYLRVEDVPTDADGAGEDEAVLLRQGYMLGSGETVGEAVEKVADEEGVKIEVLEFVRWEGGEGIEKKEDDFVGEVLRAAGKT
ncbi:elongation factor TS-domain-containing protein [Jimgerdemannia flammicorona]|uniref:Elongation factor Ts, mitochondrial n=1 Tax=Jimgerdemannia flammicorona TaxID=994334 RepID=A0A433QEJ4_9FUNG|nr:elongation factor TS-domain-containing protein [Jimgerdemannia flammicorona]